MTPQTVRAVLAYALTALVLICLVLVLFVPMSQLQTASVSAILGAVVSNWKVPLSYFYDGIASPDTVTPAPPKAPIEPAPVAPPAAP